MSRDFFDPPWQETNVVLVGTTTLQKAQQLIGGCEACSQGAEIPFDNVLDRVTGSDPSVTDYVLEGPAKCPRCRGAVTEKTLIEWVEVDEG